MTEPAERPQCYAVLDRVFPMGPDGLREVVPACFECPLRTDCLREALKTPDGMEMRAERVEAFESHRGRGMSGFLKRWSRLKQMRRG